MHILIAIALIGAIFYLYEQSTIFNGVVGGIFKGIKYLVISAIAISLIVIAVGIGMNYFEKDKPVPKAEASEIAIDYSACKSGPGTDLIEFMDCRATKRELAGRK